MSDPAPHYELKRIYDDGSESEPMLFPLHELPNALKASRRGFLAGGIAAGMVLGNIPQRAIGAQQTAKSLPRAHDGAINGLSISANGEYLATACAKDFKLWSLADKKIVHQAAAAGDLVTGLTIAADSLLVVAHKSGRIESLKNLALPLPASQGHLPAGITSLVASRDGEWLFTGDGSGAVNFISLPNLTVMASKDEHPASVTSLATSADGTILASGDVRGSIRLWNPAEQKVTAKSEGHTGRITHFAFKPEGTVAISRSDDHTLRLWKLPGGEAHRTLEGEWAKAETMALSPNGKFLLTSNRTSLDLWRIPSGESLGTLVGHRAAITMTAIAPDNSWAVSGDEAGVVILWDLRARQPKSYLFDPAASDVGQVGVTFTTTDVTTSKTITFTLPCGSAIPAGAICTCNCVPGSLEIVNVPYVQSTPNAATPRQPQQLTDAQLRRQEELEWKRQEAEQRKLDEQIRREEIAWEREERRRLRYGDRYVPVNPPYGGGGGGGGGMICTCDLIYICHAGKLLHGDRDVAALAENLLLCGGRAAMEYLSWAQTMFDGRLRTKIEVVKNRGSVYPASPWPSLKKCRDLLDSADEVIATMAAQCLMLSSSSQAADDQRQINELLSAAARRPWQVRDG